MMDSDSRLKPRLTWMIGLIGVLSIAATSCGAADEAPAGLPLAGSSSTASSSVPRLEQVTGMEPVLDGMSGRTVPGPLVRLGREDSSGCVTVGISPEELKQWLVDLGADQSTGAAIADHISAGRRDEALAVLARLDLPVTAEEALEAVEGVGVSNERTCPVEAPADEPEQPPGAMESGDRYGYYGPLFGITVGTFGGDAYVLDKTVTSESTAGGVLVRGLVANANPTPLRAIELSATIGDVTVTEALEIEVLFPGEPAPFELLLPSSAGSDSYAAEVTVVTSTKVDRSDAARREARTLDIDPLWQVPAGDRSPLNGYPYTDTDSPPYPALWFGSMRNDGSAPVVNPSAIVAWMDVDGRIVEVAEVPLSIADASGKLAPGQSGDYLIVVDAADAERLQSAELLVWGAGS